MKPLDEMKAAPRCTWKRTGYDGMAGTIQMPKWTGSIIVSWGGGWEHVSVSPFKHHITPSWDDMCYIKGLFWGKEECVVQYHPAESEYVNNMPNCLHLWRPIKEPLPAPPSILTGVRKGQTARSVAEEIQAVSV